MCEDERDQEYTIYSVLPNRQLEVVNKLEAKSQPSSTRPGGLEGLNARAKKRGDVCEGRPVGGVAITSVPQSCTVHEGKILNLTCTVDGPKYTGKPALLNFLHDISLADVCWFHGSTRLAASPRHWLYRRGPSHHLAIFDIDSSLAGEYSVCAFDNKEEAWSSFRVNVRQTRRAEHPAELVRRSSLRCSKLIFVARLSNLLVVLANGAQGLLSCARQQATPSPGFDWFPKARKLPELFPGSPSTEAGEPLGTTRTAASSTWAGGSGSVG